MPPKKSEETKKAAAAAAPVAAAAAPATPAPAKKAESKPAAAAKPAKAESKAKAEVKVEAKTEVKVEPTTTATAAATATATTTSFSSLEELEAAMAEESAAFNAAANQLIAGLNDLKLRHKNNEKRFLRELKNLQKQSSKKKRKAGNRSPSGFVKPARISEELAKFLNKSVGTEMARTEVTREINSYIKTHNLKDTTNGRKINPDAKLATLLKLKKEDELTYFNLQRYLSCHFAKAPAAVATA